MLKTVCLSENFSRRVDFEDSALEKISSVLASGGKVGVACSGGADSVFLLRCIAALFPEGAGRIEALHFNHLARANSGLDEEFVRELCGGLGIGFVRGSPERPPEKKSEAEFRRARLKFFEECAVSRGLSAIAQGHNADDVCETLLMRLMRGSGPEGFAAPRPVSTVGGAVFARPLLRIRRSEIRAMLKAAGLDWREDESNLSGEFLRNRVRSVMVPAAEKISASDFCASAARVRLLMQEESDFVDAELFAELGAANPEGTVERVGGVLKMASASDSLALGDRAAATPALFRRCLYLLLSGRGLLDNLRSKGADAFVRSVCSNRALPRRMSVADAFVCWQPAEKILKIEPARAFKNADFYDMELSWGRNFLPTGDVLEVKKVSLGAREMSAVLGGENDDSSGVFLDMASLAEAGDLPLRARARRPGDSYVPLGAGSSRSLSSLFSSKKVPAAKRGRLPVVYGGSGGILWSPGLPPARARALADSPEAIELTFRQK